MAVYDPRGGGNVHVDVVLSNIAMGYTNNEFVAEVLTPGVNVSKQSNKYYEFDREHWRLEPSETLRAPGTVATEIPGRSVSVFPYFCQEHALQIPVTDEEVANADSPLNPMSDGTELVTDRLMLKREIAVRDLVQTTANYAAGHSVTLAGVTQWSDHTPGNSSPIADHRAARDQIHSAIFRGPTVEIMPYEVISAMEDHPDMIERIKYSERGIITPEIMQAVLGVTRLVVPGAGFNSANPGQADAFGYIWGKDVVIAYVPPRAGIKIPAFMYEFRWTYSGGKFLLVDRWRETQRVSELVRARHRYDHKFIAVDDSGNSTAGYVIKAAVA